MPPDQLTRAEHTGIVHLTLHRPEKRNALATTTRKGRTHQAESPPHLRPGVCVSRADWILTRVDRVSGHRYIPRISKDMGDVMRRWCWPFLVVALCANLQGCLASYDLVRSIRGVMPLSSDTEVTRIEILKRVPVGTPIEEAKKTLAANDFSPDDWEAIWLGVSNPPAGQDLTFHRRLPQSHWDDWYPGWIRLHLTHDGSKVTGMRVEKAPG